MWNLLGTFFERQLAHALYPIFCPFLHPDAWNLDVMDGAPDPILDVEDRATPKGCGEFRGAYVSKDFVKQVPHINSGLATSTRLCEKK